MKSTEQQLNVIVVATRAKKVLEINPAVQEALDLLRYPYLGMDGEETTGDGPAWAEVQYKRAKEASLRSMAEDYKGRIDARAYAALMRYEVSIGD